MFRGLNVRAGLSARIRRLLETGKSPVALSLTLGLALSGLTPMPSYAATAGSGACSSSYTAGGTGSASVRVAEEAGYCYVSFHNRGAADTATTYTWTVPSNVSTASVLVVGGGGGGGSRHAGGGGGGEYVQVDSYALTPGVNISIQAGGGGSGAAGGSSLQGVQGQTSYFKVGANGLNALGGGGGAYNAPAGNGGSGAGGAGTAAGGSAIISTQKTLAGSTLSGVTFANAGSTGANDNSSSADFWAGGGGGGAGGAGQRPTQNGALTTALTDPATAVGGAGGAGKSPSWLPTSIRSSLLVGETSGSSVYFAAGGGGGMGADGNSGGPGGVGGGGDGVKYAIPTASNSGLTSSGGGGGGSGFDDISPATLTGGISGNAPAGNGGSGIVIVRYAATPISAPQSVTVSPGFGSLDVSWTAPADLNGQTISAYQVEYSTTGTDSWNVASNSISSTATSYSITGLTPGTPYYVRVVAKTSTWQGVYGYPWTKIFETDQLARTGSNTGNFTYTSGYGTTGNSTTLTRTDFSRVRYRIQAKYSANDPLYFADVDFGKNISSPYSGSESYDSLSRLQVPVTGSAFELAGDVSDLSIASNVPGVTVGTGFTGRLEIWPWDYGTPAASGASVIAGASETKYDFADNSSDVNYYGSFQIHNIGSSPQTIVAWNAHYYWNTPSEVDLGFGNNTGAHPDWTSAGAQNEYTVARTDFLFQSFANLSTEPLQGRTITFEKNDGTASTATQVVQDSTATNLTANAFTRSGFEFLGWNTLADGSGTKYVNSQSVTLTSDLTLYAIWASTTPLISLNSTDLNSFNPSTGAITDLGSLGVATTPLTSSLAHKTLDLTSSAERAWSFAGGASSSGDFVDVGDISTAPFQNYGLTVDFEANFGAINNNWERIFDFSVGGSAQDNLWVGRNDISNNISFEVFSGSTSQGLCSTTDNPLATPSLSRWTISIDGTSCKIYRDGSLLRTVSYTALPTNTTWGQNYIAKSNWSGDSSFAGQLRYLRIYAGAMTPSQIGSVSYKTVTFDADGGALNSAPASLLTSGTISLPTTGPTKTGYDFAGWAESAGGSDVGATFTPASDDTLYAVWGPKTYAVTFDSKGGSAVPDSSFQTSGSLTSPTPPARDGYSFAGWSATDGGALVVFPYSPGVTNDITLYAKWTWLGYEQKFNNNGGAGTTASEYAYTGEQITLPSAPLRSGYTFNGWSTAASGGTIVGQPAASYSPLTKDNLILRYEFDNLNSYSGSGTTVTDIASRVNSNVTGSINATTTNNPTFGASPGYLDFITANSQYLRTGNLGVTGRLGTATDGSSTNNNVSMFTWVYPQNNNGVIVSELGQTSINTSWHDSQIEMVNGKFSFNVWTGSYTLPHITTTSAVTLNKWYYVGFTYNGTTLTAYVFNDEGNAVTLSNNNRTLTKMRNSAIYYGLAAQDGTNMGSGAYGDFRLGSFQVYNTGLSSTTVLNNFKNTCVRYLGEISGCAIPTLYASWTANTYNVSYDEKGGSTVADGTFVTDGTVTFPANPTRSGYTFLGWSETDGGSVVSSPYSPSATSDITLYAVWQLNTFEITYNSNSATSGSAPASQTKTEGVTLTLATNSGNLDRTGYTFDGWNTQADGNGTAYAAGGSYTADSADELFAKWNINTYSVSYDELGGSSVSDGSFTYGGTVTFPTDPTRSGYRFDGWSASNGGLPLASPYSPGVAQNVTLYALWTLTTIPVTWDSNSGSAVSNSSYQLGQALTKPTDPSKTDYIFGGWSTSETSDQGDGANRVTWPYSPTETTSLTLYAIWLSVAPPQNVAVTSGQGQLTITWSAPVTAVAEPPTGYQVEYSTTGLDGWTVASSSLASNATSHTITGLTNGTNYYLRVAALYSGQFGAYGYPWTKLYEVNGERKDVNGSIPYASGYGLTGGAATANADADFSRIRYRMQANYGGQLNYADVDFYKTLDPKSAVSETFTSVSMLQVPTHASSRGGVFEIQGNVSDMTIQSNVGVVNLGVGITGRLEIWPWNYASTKSAPFTDGDGNSFDLNDTPSTSGDHSSFQVHDISSQQTVMAWNLHRASATDSEIGFGNNNSGTGSPDWTYSTQAEDQFNLQIFANIPTAPSASITVTFNANDGSGTPATDTQAVVYDAATALNANAFTRSGYLFAGWNEAADGTGTGFVDEQDVTLTADVTLYAIWNEICSPTTSQELVSGTYYTVVKFTSVADCYWQIPAGIASVDALIVGGGGGGGGGRGNGGTSSWYGGGGGGGGAAYQKATNVSVTAGEYYQVVVGSGGTAGTQSLAAAGNGGPSSFAGSYLAAGGSGGSRSAAVNTAGVGGVAGTGSGQTAGSAGGKGAAGIASTTATRPVSGGAARQVSLAGTTYCVGGGGGGGNRGADATHYNFQAQGGSCASPSAASGGNGRYYAYGAGNNYVGPTAGTANTGGGGGGGSYNSGGGTNGADGGSGLVVLAYAAPTYTVALSTDGGDAISDLVFPIGGSALTLPLPTKTGYTFAGWYQEVGLSNLVGVDGDSYTPTGDSTLYAKWTANANTVTFKANYVGGATDETQTINSGTSTNLDANPFTRTGYTFAGWATNANGSGATYEDEEAVTITAALTLYAQWEVGTYTVTYNYNGATGGNTSATGSHTTGAVALLLPTPTKAGYTFDGWYEASNFSGTKLGATYTTTADVTIFAKWTAATYTVLYDYVGADGSNTTESDSYTTGSTEITLPSPTKTGYTFAGWYESSIYSGSAKTSPYTTTLNRTLYAKWTAIDYSVTYETTDSTGGTEPTDSANYNLGQNVTIKINSGSLTRTGYTLAGWVLDPTDVNETAKAAGSRFVMPASDVTLYPVWSANTYTLTFNSNGATSGAPVAATDTYTTGTGAKSLPGAGTLAKTGYNFLGWNINATDTTALNSITTTQNLTLYAIWELVPYSFTYNLNGGSGATPSTQTANITEQVTVSAIGAATKSGHWFAGWNSESDGSGSDFAAGVTTSIPIGGETLYAVWVPDQYRISYNANGGTGGPDLSATGGFDEATFGSTYNIRPKGNLARTGYSFSHWTTNSAGTGTKYDQAQNVLDEEISFIPTQNTTFYAQWTAISYSHTFDVAGGSASLGTYGRTIGQQLTMPSAGTKSGYTFDSWTDGTNDYPVGSTYTVIAASVTFTAQWTPNVYTVVYDWQGGYTTGTPATSANYTVGSGVMALPSGVGYAKDGYTFAGWSTTAGGTVALASWYPLGDDVLYAIWEDGEYILSYNAKGGNAGTANGSVNRGSAVTLPTPVRSGFVFQGWYDQETNGNKLGNGGDSYTPSMSKTMFARWVQKSLSGVDLAKLDTAATLSVGSGRSGGSLTRNHAATGTSASVVVPNGALPENTTVTARYFKDTERQAELIPGDNNYIFSLLVSWITGSGDTATVPDTEAGTAISVTLTSDAIKAGQRIYQVVGDEVTDLGTATQDGTITVQLTQDPEIIVAATAPEAPTSVSATAGDASASVSWTAPSNGGSEILNYTVTASPGGATCTTTATSCEVTGLTNGTAYTFRVTATNAVGTSAQSSASTAITPALASFTVTYNSNGGSTVAAGNFISGGSISAAPTAPARSGYTFGGWSTTLDDAATVITFPYTPGVTQNITLYALWTAVSSSGGSSSSGSSPAPITPSDIGYTPKPPTTPVATTGPVGEVNGSNSGITFTTDSKDQQLLAKGSGWQLEFSAKVGDRIQAVEDLSLTFTVAASAQISGSGLKPNSVVEAWVFSEPTYVGKISIDATGSFESELNLPKTLLPGEHTLQIGTLNAYGQLVTISIPITIKGKVTVGTFKGYIAIYTQDLYGQRLSAKVAGKWMVQNSVARFKNYNFSRMVRYTGSGYDIQVDVYINRKFFERTLTTTR